MGTMRRRTRLAPGAIAVIALVALGCGDAGPDRERTAHPTPEPAVPGRTEPRPLAPARHVPTGAGAPGCPEGTREIRLVVEAIDTVMTGCVREGEGARRVQHGPWQKERGGVVVERGAYRDGERDGVWRFTWDDGTPRAEGEYRAGQKVGAWRYFTPDGSLLRVVDHAPEPEADEPESAENAAEPEPEQVSVSLRLENSHETPLLFALEPWAEEYDLLPGSTVEVEAQGPDTGDLVVESSEDAITVWAWEGSEVKLWVDGVEVLP